MKKYTASVEAQHKGADPVMDMVMCLLHSVTNAHILHFSTTSYSAHKALKSFYEDIGGLVDGFVEAFQGKYGLLTDYKAEYALPANPIDYLNYLKAEVEKLRRDPAFPQDSELQNEVDTIANLINFTIYKLRFLK
jgi:hypothetical protein